MNGVQPTLIDYQGITMNNSTLERNVTLTMDGTSQGLVLQYDKQSLNPKQFTITHNGIDYTDNTNNNTTSLQRLAQVQQAFQAVELPPDSTTLQVNKKLLLQDPAYNTVSGSMSVDSVGNLTIDASNNLVLNPIGTINASGKTINMGNGQIHNCDLINSQNNADITIEGRGTGDVILKTGDRNRLTISDTGAWTCDGSLSYASGIMSFPSPPTCTIPATTSYQLVNFNNFADIAGSWTPTIYGAMNSSIIPPYSTRVGRYIRINNFCCFQLSIAIDSSGGMPGQIRLTLPIPSNTNSNGACSISLIELNTSTTMVEFAASIVALTSTNTYIGLDYRSTTTIGSFSTFQASTLGTSGFKIKCGGFYICQ